MEYIYNISELKEKLNPLFISSPIYKATLFGSYAKGAATIKSDVDICIDSRGELCGLKFYGVLEDMVEILKKQVDLFDVSEIRKNSYIENAINKQGVILFER